MVDFIYMILNNLVANAIQEKSDSDLTALKE